jgi:hypothetical protein
MPKGQAVEELFLALHGLSPEDCTDQVMYLMPGQSISSSSSFPVVVPLLA